MNRTQFTNLQNLCLKKAKTFFYLIAILTLCSSIGYAQVPDLLIQATSIVPPNNTKSQSNGIAVDASGNIYSTGLFQNSVTFGSTTLVSAGALDVFITKYDNAGNFQWAKRAGGVNNDIANGIAISGNDIYITGYFGSTANFNTPSATGSNQIVSAGSDDIFIAKYDDAGTFQWAKRAGGTSSDIAYGIAVSGSDVYITGYFSGTANFNNPSAASGFQPTATGVNDVFMAKYNSAGTYQWASAALGNGIGSDIAYGVAISGSDIYITGSFSSTLNFSASISVTSAGDQDIFLAQYSTDGDIQWARRGGGIATDYAHGIAVSGNDVYISGRIGSNLNGNIVSNFNTPSAFGSNEITAAGQNFNILLAKFDNTGAFQWARRGGGGAVSLSYGVAVSGSDVYMTGYFRNIANFNNPSAFGSNEITSGFGSLQDMFLAKYNATGTFQGAVRGGGLNEDTGFAIATSGSSVYVSGSFKNTANFNTPSVAGSNELTTPAITGDAFVARYTSFALPIELLTFKGQSTERGNLLTWITSSEAQNKGFEIEISKDGIRFDKIGFVAGNGTSSQVQNYRFEDFFALENSEKITYYRLKQLDFDGNFKYSKIISISRNGKNKVSVFPNPSNGIFTLTGVENIEDETFTIVNSIGQTLPIVIQNNLQFDMSSFPSGIYYLRIASSGQVEKLIKE